MSTKIYNGIKFKSNNLNEILSQLQTIRNILLNICGSEEYVPQENLIEFINYKKLISNIDDNETKLMFGIHRKIKDAIILNDEDVRWLIPFNVTVYVLFISCLGCVTLYTNSPSFVNISAPDVYISNLPTGTILSFTFTKSNTDSLLN